jgi:hypothetical protein
MLRDNCPRLAISRHMPKVINGTKMRNLKMGHLSINGLQQKRWDTVPFFAAISLRFPIAALPLPHKTQLTPLPTQSHPIPPTQTIFFEMTSYRGPVPFAL